MNTFLATFQLCYLDVCFYQLPVILMGGLILTDYPPLRSYTLSLEEESSPLISDHLKLGGSSPQGETISFTSYYAVWNGRPCLPIMGEFHFMRFPRQYWRQELQKMRAGGIQIVATYLFWIYIEEDESIFDWSGDRDVRTFLEICRQEGLLVLLRTGPFAHGECRNGGLPDWLYGQSFPVRSNDERYLAYVRRYYEQIGKQVAGLFFQDGGPVIGIQLENEYMHCGAPWEVTFKQGSTWIPAGTDGAAHLQRLKQLAQAADLQAPIYSCTAWAGSPVPEDEFLPMHGGYAFTPWHPDPTYQQEPTYEFLFRDRHRQPLRGREVLYRPELYPYACCELGSGIQITYHHRPVVPAECVQAQAIVALGSGANILGYYMYHGGSHAVGKHAFLNEFTVPRISYDFQAPLGEYGQIHQSYHHLRALHLFLREFGELLAPMTVMLPEQAAQLTPETTDTLRFAVRSNRTSGFLFLNNYQDHVEMREQSGIQFVLHLPDKTLTLPQCQTLIVPPGVSAILPFQLLMDDRVLLTYATAQVLTVIRGPEQTTYVFFAPDGMHAEFAFEKATYQAIEVTGGESTEEQAYSYIMAEPGLHCSIQLTARDGKHIRLLVLTQDQAYSSWKVHFQGQERLILSDALVLVEESDLHLSWRGQEAVSLAIYPSLREPPVPLKGQVTSTVEGEFTRYEFLLPVHHVNLSIERLDDDMYRIGIPPAALDGAHDAFLCIEYVGDMGEAYLNGQLVSDHFANGLPWEIGLKRFLAIDAEQEREMILRFSPLQPENAVRRYFPTGMAFRPDTAGVAAVDVLSLTVHPEYHGVLCSANRAEKLHNEL